MTVEGFDAFKVTPTRVAVGGSVKIKGAKLDDLEVLLPGGSGRDIKLNNKGEYTLKEPLGREGFFSIADSDTSNQNVVRVDVFQLD